MTKIEHFPWPEVHAARREIDVNLGSAPMDMAKQDFLSKASPYPGCGAEPDALFWMFVSASEAEWTAGRGRAGFLTLCDRCSRQVDFFRDAELEEIQREEHAQSDRM